MRLRCVESCEVERPKGRTLLACASGLFIALLSGSCGGTQRNEDFVPSDTAARQALETYLSAWQRGEREVAIANTTPQVMASDSLRASGRSLSGFTVVGPVAGDAARCFAVRLSLTSPTEEMRERYVVIGLDPLWVFRYPDYEMLMHWDHPMPKK
jgi:hypothetical protein